MKKYPKTYEDHFTSRRTRETYNSYMTHIDDEDMTIEQYKELWKEHLEDAEKFLWGAVIKNAWLMHKFCYGSGRKKCSVGSGIHVNRAFGTFLRSHVGKDYRPLVWWPASRRLTTYLPDLVPNINDINPFEKIPEFPYKHITPFYLAVVACMDERLKLLEHAEEKKLAYDAFLDYVINYTSCYNEEHDNKYVLRFNGFSGFEVTRNREYEGTKKKA